MSGFTDEEIAAEAARLRAADLAKDIKTAPDTGLTSDCVHCGRAFALHEGHVGEVSLCDYCLHKD